MLKSFVIYELRFGNVRSDWMRAIFLKVDRNVENLRHHICHDDDDDDNLYLNTGSLHFHNDLAVSRVLYRCTILRIRALTAVKMEGYFLLLRNGNENIFPSFPSSHTNSSRTLELRVPITISYPSKGRLVFRSRCNTTSAIYFLQFSRT